MRIAALAVLLLALATGLTQANPQAVDPRTMAMGSAQIAVADGANAFLANPAGLPFLKTFGVAESGASANVVGFSTSFQEDAPDQWSLLYSGRSTTSRVGWGVGYFRSNGPELDTNTFAAGVGAQLCIGEDFTGGLLIADTDSDVDEAQEGTVGGEDLFFDVALMKRVPVTGGVWKFGLIARDVINQLPGKATFDLGASLQSDTGLLLAFDVVDLTEENEIVANLGAEYAIPQSPVLVRAGLSDGDLTLGGGYRWRNLELAGAWADSAAGDTAVVGLTGCW